MILAGLLLLLLALPCQVSAAAASAYGFGGRRALLALRNINSSVHLKYQFEHSKSWARLNNKYSSHEFTEEFQIGGTYSLYKPRVWRGRYKLALGADQMFNYQNNKSAGKTSVFISSYEVYGYIYQASRTPLQLKAYARETRVNRRFSQDYYLWTESFFSNLSIHNRTFPAQVSYTKSTTETSGLANNRITDAQTISMSLAHRQGSVSSTSFSYSQAEHTQRLIEAGTVNRNERAVTQVKNILRWPFALRKLKLTSSYRYTENSGIADVIERNWDEELEWLPGRALRVNLLRTDDRTTAFGAETSMISNRGNLSYSLFRSVSLGLVATETERTFSGGEQQSDSVTARMSYRKIISDDSKFSLSFEKGIENMNREQVGTSQNVFGEEITIDLGGFNFLANYNVVEPSVVVRDATGTILYFQGLDYSLVTFANRTEIVLLPGSAISDTDELRIDYEFILDPSIGWTGDSTYVTTDYSVYDGDLRFSASYSSTDIDQTSGVAEVVQLSESRVYSLAMAAKYEKYHFNARYTNTETISYETEQFESTIGRSTNFAGGHLTFDVGDVYMIYRADESVRTNRLSSRAVYRRRVGPKTMMSVEADALLATGDGLDRFVAGIKTGFDIRFRKTFFKISIDEEYLDYETRQAWNQSFLVSMRRNF